MADYRRLRAWARAHDLVLAVYRATERFPASEQFGLTSQIRRSAASVPANIAEGYGRSSDRELARYCRVALGSINELEYHLVLARDLGMLVGGEHAELELQLRDVRRMLTGLVRRIVRGT